MSSCPKFSVVIPAYNEEKTLSECIVCARKQSGNFDYEIIVVDNNSTDRTVEIARGLGVIVVEEKRQGVGWARRAGTAAVTGDLILHLDADTHLPPDYLQQVCARFASDPKLVCVGGQMVYYDAPRWLNVLRVFVHYSLGFVARTLSWGKIGPMGN